MENEPVSRRVHDREAFLGGARAWTHVDNE